MATYTANAYSTECKMSASACTSSMAGYMQYIWHLHQTAGTQTAAACKENLHELSTKVFCNHQSIYYYVKKAG